MAGTPSVVLGDVVYVDIPDPEGKPCDHPHPAMIFRGPDHAGRIYVIAISTKFEAHTERFTIRLQWSKGGHHVTGLDQPCVLKCFWVVPFNVRDVIRVIGKIPPEIAEQATDYVITWIEEKKKQSILSQTKSSKRK